MKYIHYSIYVAYFVIFLLNAKDPGYANSLTKVFVHQGQVTDKVVCYFTKEPICNAMPGVQKNTVPGEVQALDKNSKKQLRFFIPLTTIVGEAQNSLSRRPDIAHEHYYTISFNEVNKPLEGVEVTIEYNPQYIGFELETFDAIHTHKGLVFKFHYKQILQELNIKTNHLLQYAYNIPNKKPTIVIDNGHGGNDLGKVGCYNIKEKDLNLQVGTQVAQMLEQKGYNVMFTRQTDTFVPLDQRTTQANIAQADLFISIHANSAERETISGLETYWAPQGLLTCQVADIDEQSKRILADITKKKDCASKKLATNLHNNILGQAKKMYAVKDRKVKETISQVLLGTDMPGALIELGFLSNKEETDMLMQSTYQKAVVSGICNGIELYLKEV